MAFGTFDTLHPGHAFFLKKARKLGDCLVVIVARDRTVKKVKNHPPLNTEDKRVKNLLALGLAEKVSLGRIGNDKYAVIRDENPDVIALGYDQKFFIDGLKKAFPDAKIVRIKSFHPDIYHSSIIKGHSVI